jgi:hypothetical protein
MPSKQDNIIYPYVPLHLQIGVTGHRDLVFTQQLEKSINDALTIEIKNLLSWDEKFNTPLTYSILTPLAEGADRFVAKQAKKLLNATIEVVLPMTEEEYMVDFTSPESCAEFRNMLKHASGCHRITKKKLVETYPETEDKERREIAYKNVGQYVVDNCDILIAILDEDRAESNAGTSATVQDARDKSKPLIIISPKVNSKPELEKGNGDIESLLNKFELFNAHKVDPAELDAEIKKLSGYLFSDEEAKRPPQKNIEFTQKFLMPWFVRADTIALKSQRRYQRVGLLIYILSPVAVALVALGILIHQVSWLFFSLEFIILIFAYVAISLAESSKIHKKWVECRYLAEHLRCSLYFTICGIEPALIKNYEQWHISHHPDNWAAEVFNEIIKNLQDIPVYKQAETKTGVDYIKEYWILDQEKYHIEKIKIVAKKGKQLKIIGEVIFFMALASAFIHILLVLNGFERKALWTTDLLIFIAISFPALTASLSAIRIHREYSRIEQQSIRMVRSLKTLKKECNNIRTMHELSKFMVDVQTRMLRDVENWHHLMDMIIITSL